MRSNYDNAFIENLLYGWWSGLLTVRLIKGLALEVRLIRIGVEFSLVDYREGLLMSLAIRVRSPRGK